jgi:hypothetical protein
MKKSGKAPTSGPGVSNEDSPAPPALDEAFLAALDLETWVTGERMYALGPRLERSIELAAHHEAEMAPRLRKALEDNLQAAAGTSKELGLYTATVPELVAAQRALLFSGLVEACDGTRFAYDALPVTVIQIGVSLTTYQGDGASIGHRLYRHDITEAAGDTEERVLAFIRARARRAEGDLGGEGEDPDDSDEQPGITSLLGRAIMTYAERAMLAERSTQPWRMGHGSAIPYELIIGANRPELVRRSLPLLRRLLVEHKRFIFVPSTIKDRAVKTLANALRPMQYAVLGDTTPVIRSYLRGGYERQHYTTSGLRQEIERFGAEVAPRVLQCIYRATALGPGNIFYAHEDHVHEAARIVLADSAMQDHRGFPNLIDTADRMCGGLFEPASVVASVEAAFARLGEPFQHLTERATRNR